MTRFALILALLLSACQTPAAPVERIVTQTVDRPVPVACVPADMPEPPARTATRERLGASPAPDAVIVALTEELVRTRGWVDQAAAVLAACRRAAAP